MVVKHVFRSRLVNLYQTASFDLEFLEAFFSRWSSLMALGMARYFGQRLFRIWQRFPYFSTSFYMLSKIFPEELLALQENTKPVWKHVDLHISYYSFLFQRYLVYLHWRSILSFLRIIFHFWLFRETFPKCFKEFNAGIQ